MGSAKSLALVHNIDLKAERGQSEFVRRDTSEAKLSLINDLLDILLIQNKFVL